MSAYCAYRLATPAGGSGAAIAIIELVGDDVDRILKAITQIKKEWPIGLMRLANLGGVDDGIAVRTGERTAQLMPHGGPRVVQLLRMRLNELGAEPLRAILPREAYPEAANDDEALMLEALARAASPAAIDLLLDQPRRWRAWRERPPVERESIERIRERSVSLNRFLEPPIVVVTGPPNIGKSTLLNVLAGRSISVAADQPGVTRDYVGALIDLRGMVVQWYDTPGRDSSKNSNLDAIEDAAMRISERLIARADLIIAGTDDPCGERPASPRAGADLHILLKADKYPETTPRAGFDLAVSALSGDGLSELVELVRERLTPSVAHQHPGPWLFDERLIGGT